MGKLKEVHIFSNEEGAIAKYFIALAIYTSAVFISHLLVSLIEKEPIGWMGSILVILIIAAIASAVYFLSRFLAYRTKIFPKTENREGIHGVSFVFLLLVSFIITFVII